VEVGKTSSLTAIPDDPDGDVVQFSWKTAAGTIGDTRVAKTVWTAETVPGTYPVTVTVDDGKGGVATDTVNIEVFRRNLAFNDVNFDLDKSDLRPEARTILDQAARTLKENPDVKIQIEGHASEEGTEEYNMALGNRRAIAVRTYLVSQGIDASRLDTISYGKSRPKYDNSKEETRRLNRRSALVVEGAK
jgi:peptidoglycan-associated lipoprotein